MAEDLKKGGFDLPHVGIVHAAQVFTFPGEENPIARFRGFLLGEHRFNVYWQKREGNEGGNVPPDCVAKDCKTASRPAEPYTATVAETGEVKDVTIYGSCATCWFNQFGSAKVGRGKSCANKSNLLIWPEGRNAIVPYLLTVSSTSLSGGIQSLAQKQIRDEAMAVYNSPQKGTLAEFWLEKRQNGQQVWSVLNAKVIGGIGDGKGTVSPEVWPRIKSFVDTFLPQLSEAPVDGDEQTQEVEAEVVQPPAANDDVYPPTTEERRDRFAEAKANAIRVKP